MNKRLTIVLATILCSQAPCFAENGLADFDRLKSLVGEWQGKDDDGQPSTVTYELSSGGTALYERLTPGKNAPQMISVYHMDNGKLMMTHYCARDNQPRMKANAYDPATHSIAFTFIDATNLAKPSDGHMHGLTLNLPDSKHLTQQWDWQESDRHSPAIFHFERKTAPDVVKTTAR